MWNFIVLPFIIATSATRKTISDRQTYLNLLRMAYTIQPKIKKLTSENIYGGSLTL